MSNIRALLQQTQALKEYYDAEFETLKKEIEQIDFMAEKPAEVKPYTVEELMEFFLIMVGERDVSCINIDNKPFVKLKLNDGNVILFGREI